MHRSLADYLAEVRRAIPTKDRLAPADVPPTSPITIDLTEYRPLTSEERSFLTWLLEHGTAGSDAFLPQLEGLLVKNWCTCGCPSLSLHVDEDEKLAKSFDHMLTHQIGTVEGLLVGVILRQRGGRLVDLELYDIEGLDRGFGFPDVATLYTLEGGPPPDQS